MPWQLPKSFPVTDLSSENPELHSELYDYISNHLTPKHFLSDEEFNDHKLIYFKVESRPASNSSDKIKQEFYDNPKNLSELGKRKVSRELKRINNIYNINYKEIITTDTRELKYLLSPDEFLSLYLYTTNLGYPKINRQLRLGEDNGCAKWIELINSSIDKLSVYPRFSLAKHQHKLTRHFNVPDDVLQTIKDCTLARQEFIDSAYLSTSFNNGGAQEFKGNIELNIEMRGSLAKCIGIRIDDISPFRSEGECLFRPGTSFECNPAQPIEYDAVHNKLKINLCSVTIASLTSTLMYTTKFIHNLKISRRNTISSIQKATDSVIDPVLLSSRSKRSFSLPAIKVDSDKHDEMDISDKKYIEKPNETDSQLILPGIITDKRPSILRGS